MPTYTLTFEGREHVSKKIECETLDDAQNEAVRYLGTYLADHPGFATEGHWRVNVEDETNRQLLHVIVATVVSKYSRDLRAMEAAS